jgi:hypothetical protein
MSAGFPVSPQVHKGAIVGLDPFNPVASLIVFQYNPESMTRNLQVAAATQATEDQSEQLRFVSPPTETISVDIELDATDQLERGDGITQSLGIHPALASLEMLIYPKALTIIANDILNLAGLREVIPPQAPLALFVWGIKRVVPVRISGMSITEDFFDPSLNPLHAKVHLDMRVLNYRDLGLTSPGGALFLAHQILKEAMATLAGVGTIAGTASASVSGSFSF